MTVEERNIFVFASNIFFWQGLALDRTGLLLAVKTDKVTIMPCDTWLHLHLLQSGSHIQVFNFQEGSLHSLIDSHGARLRRPTGAAGCRCGYKEKEISHHCQASA